MSSEHPPIPRCNHYIGGDWVPTVGEATIAVINPSTERAVARVPAGNPGHIDRAVMAARGAFPDWASTTQQERSDWLWLIARGLERRRELIAQIVSLEMGMPIGQSREFQAGMPLHNVRYYAELARTYNFEHTLGNSLIRREPIGVVGCITPWNFPLHQVVLKVAPALAAGCTVVLKPSEIAPLSAALLAEVIDETRLPPGVFNLVHGLGPTVGHAIAEHPEIDMVSFTGSDRAGKTVAADAAQTVKRVSLELGGKSPHVILEDADLEQAVLYGISECFLNSGQNCASLSRMIVPRRLQRDATEIATTAATCERLGNPFDEHTTLGPIVSESQLLHVQTLIETGISDGATLQAGGPGRPLRPGYYLSPTIFSDVLPRHRIARREIFGPVLAIMTYDSPAEAIRIANDSDYGLYGSVWSASQDHATEVARALRVGQVTVNGGDFSLEAPFGGYKQSGIGREAGVYGLEECLEVKAIHL